MIDALVSTLAAQGATAAAPTRVGPTVAATATAAASAVGDAVPPGTVNDRLCHLFRGSIRQGRIHPLYLPVLRYRHATR